MQLLKCYNAVVGCKLCVIDGISILESFLPVLGLGSGVVNGDCVLNSSANSSMIVAT